MPTELTSEGAPKHIKIEETFFIRSYDFYNVNSPGENQEHLNQQRHVDIRTFTSDSKEEWTVGTIGPQSVIAGLPGLELTFSSEAEEEIFPAEELFPEETLYPGAGITVYPSTTTSISKVVNLRNGFSPEDYIILALPEFPLKKVAATLSFLELTSHPTGDFEHGPTAAVALSKTLTPLQEGNSEFRVERSLFEKNELNLAQITGVRIRFSSRETGSLTVAGLRLVDRNWGYMPIDFDDWNGRWRNPVPPDGDLAGTKVLSPLPILWRSDDPSGTADPTIIDGRIGVTFYTGSQEQQNEVTVYMRELADAFLAQIDLDGKSMGALDHHPQPDAGIKEFDERRVGSLDKIDLSELDDLSMRAIERVEDPTFQSWVSFQVKWGSTHTVTIGNSAEQGFTFNLPALSDQSYYLAIMMLEDTAAHLILYKLNPDFSIIPTPIFDSTEIRDGGFFKRRKGRIGWQAQLGDNDAFVKSIHPRGLTYAEYLSAPLHSITPVDGAELFATFSPDIESFIGFRGLAANADTTILTRDLARSTSGSSYRLEMKEGETQGLESNAFSLIDLTQTTVGFDVWYPGNLPGLKVRLLDQEGVSAPLSLPFIYRDQWQKVSIPLIEAPIPTGEYVLIIEQPGEAEGVWWVDSIAVLQRAVQWSARAIADDPWFGNDAPWTDFRDIINVDGGITFPTRGRELQLRAKARRQDAIIAGAPKLRPKYAQLGRLVWPEDTVTATAPTANFTNSAAALKVTFTSTSTAGSSPLSLFEWDFGDGQTAIGQKVVHTYAAKGEYTAALNVTDSFGLHATHLTVITL